MRWLHWVLTDIYQAYQFKTPPPFFSIGAKKFLDFPNCWRGGVYDTKNFSYFFLIWFRKLVGCAGGGGGGGKKNFPLRGKYAEALVTSMIGGNCGIFFSQGIINKKFSGAPRRKFPNTLHLSQIFLPLVFTYKNYFFSRVNHALCSIK